MSDAISNILTLIDAAGPPPDPAVLAAQSENRATSTPARVARTRKQRSDGEAGRHSESSSASGDGAPVPSSPPAAPPPSSKKASSLRGAKADSGGGGGAGGGEPPETPEQLNLRLAYFRHTDLGNVFRFVERNRGKLLYNESLPGTSNQDGGWLWWDGRRWAHSGADAKVRIAQHECVQAIGDEAKACAAEADRLARENADIVERTPAPKKKKDRKAGGDNVITVDFRAKVRAPALSDDGGEDDHDASSAGAPQDDRDPAKLAGRITTLFRLSMTLKDWARKSEANGKIVPLARQASAYLRTDMSLLDADRLTFNVNNGTLVFRREWDATNDPAIADHENWYAHGSYIKFKPHCPTDYITKVAPVDFLPAAECLKFLSFLGEVQPAPEMCRFLQEWKGYQMTGETGESRMCIFHGKGRNGKGVFEDATSFVLGDYGGSTPVKTFLIEGVAKGAGQATPELAKLPGIRSLRTSEPSKDAKLDEALIKLVTGGDPIDARHLNRPFFTFLPDFKLTMLTNHQPKIFGVDEGIWARVTLVPWSIIVPAEKRDQRLAFKLRAESSGILNWMLDGLSVWLERGLILPDQVKEATASYRSESDPLGQFLAACTEMAPGEKTQATPFHEVFDAWCKANAGPTWTPRGLSMAMQGRGFRATKISVMYWLDIRLTKAVHDFVDSQGRPHGGNLSTKTDGNDDEGPTF